MVNGSNVDAENRQVKSIKNRMKQWKRDSLLS